MKEEGQSLVHAAHTWGDKTLASSSPPGREAIRHDLGKLQADWDVFISSVSDTHSTLESCLLRWADYSDTNEQILKWIRDTERRLGDTGETKTDLSEKKALLQKTKVGMARKLHDFHVFSWIRLVCQTAPIFISTFS